VANPNNKISTPKTQIFSRRSYPDMMATRANSNLVSNESIGKSSYEGIVVGIILESTEVSPNAINIAGYNIAVNSEFTPTNVPYAYIVNIPEKGYICSGELPNPNTPQYSSYLNNLLTTGFVFKVRPGQSMDLANVGDTVSVKFNGPDFSSDGYYVGNISSVRGLVSYPPPATSAHKNGKTWTAPTTSTNTTSDSENTSVDPGMSTIATEQNMSVDPGAE
jgi:hypothetical protein